MDQPTIAALLTFLAKLDSSTLLVILGMLLLSPAGVVILIVILWNRAVRKQDEQLKVYRDDVMKVAMFYESNVELVKATQQIAAALHDTVVLNTSTMQRMIDVCITNQFCPNARLPK